MAKKKKEALTPDSVLSDLNQNLRVYGMDFQLLEKSKRKVAYIRVKTRMNRPAPNAVIGHLKVTGWRALQRHEFKYNVYRYYKPGMILVVVFPDIKEYDLRGNTPESARLSSDHEVHERFFGIIKKSGEKLNLLDR